MSVLTLNVKELQARWIKLYVNINMLRSKDPKVTAILKPFKLRISMFNEEIMAFFSKLEELVEAEDR